MFALLHQTLNFFIMADQKNQIVSDEDKKLLDLFSLVGKRAEQKSPAIASCFGNNDAQGSLFTLNLALDSLVELGCAFDEDSFVELIGTLQKSNIDGVETIIRALYSATRYINDLDAYRGVMTDLIKAERML